MPFQLIMLLITVALNVASQLLAPKSVVKKSTLNDFQVPTTTEDRPKPVWVGTVRHKSPNCIWYGDFSATAIKSKIGILGFITLGLSAFLTRQTIGYHYNLGIQLSLGWGPLDVLRRITLNDKVAWTGSVSSGNITIDQPKLFGGDEIGGSGGFQGIAVVYPGDGSQSADPYVVSKSGATPAYKNDVLIVFKGLTSGGAYVANTTTFPDVSFDISRYPNTLGIGSGKHIIDTYDANPVCALYEFMTQPDRRWGAGFATSQIDTTTWLASAETLYDEGIGMSRLFDNVQDVETIVNDYLHLIDGVLNVNPSTGKIELKLIRDDYDPDDLIEIGEDDVIEVVSYKHGSWIDTMNEVKLTYIDRTQEFEEIPAAAQDGANSSGQEEVRSLTLDFAGISTGAVANKIVFRSLRVASIPLATIGLKINRKAYALEGGSVFKWVGTRYGVAGMIFRVGEGDGGTLADGTMQFTAIQDVFALSEAAFLPPEGSGWEPVGTDAANITDERIIEQPYGFHNSDDNRAMTVAARPNGVQLSYNLRTKLSAETTYLERLTSVAFTPLGSLTGDYSSGAFVTDGSLIVTPVSLMEDLPDVVTPDEIVTGQGLILIGDEILAYESYTVDTSGNFVFDNVWGGLLDTLLADHIEDADVWLISEGLGLDPTNYAAGVIVNAKLLSNSNTEQIAEGTATTITL